MAAVNTPVPGPPRGRRPRVPGDILRRIEAMREAETSDDGGRSAFTALLRLAGEVAILLKDLARDARVPRREKLVAGAVAVYLLSPLDLIPDWVPLAGQVDDVAIALWALRRLVAAAGYDVVYQLWRGSDEGLAVVLAVAGVER